MIDHTGEIMGQTMYGIYSDIFNRQYGGLNGETSKLARLHFQELL